MGNRLRNLRTAKGWTHDQAAAAMGMSRGQFIKLERGERRLNQDHLRKASQVFGVTEAEVLGGASAAVPIVGIAGASVDGGISYEFESGELGEAPMPPGGNARTVAVEVRGDSLRGVAEDGWLVYYDDRRDPMTEDLIGELCVVGIEDGRTLVKTPYRGRAPGLFDLESTNAPTIRDVGVRWAALVTAIVPRRPARSLIRRRS